MSVDTYQVSAFNQQLATGN